MSLVIGQNSLKTTISTFDSLVIRSCALKPGQIRLTVGVKEIFSQLVLFLSWEGNKKINNFSTGNSKFCFPSILDVPLSASQCPLCSNVSLVLEKQNLLLTFLLKSVNK